MANCVRGQGPSARFAVKFCPLGDTRDCGAEPLPAAETGEAEQGPRSVFCKGAATPAAKAGNRNQGISDLRRQAEMGSPWSVPQGTPTASAYAGAVS